jgi:uncharacterized protein (DUF486 family)
VDFIVRIVVNVVLIIMKNTMMYFLWFSECRHKDDAYYESLHHFTIGIVVRVAVSSNIMILSFILGKVADWYQKKHIAQAKVEHADELSQMVVDSTESESETEHLAPTAGIALTPRLVRNELTASFDSLPWPAEPVRKADK